LLTEPTVPSLEVTLTEPDEITAASLAPGVPVGLQSAPTDQSALLPFHVFVTIIEPPIHA
jgi:hypothetical protein